MKEVDLDEVLCREVAIRGDIIKFKECLSNSKINLEKKIYGKSTIELISQYLHFEFFQELPKSIPIDLNFNDTQLPQQNIEKVSQAITNIQRLRSLRFLFFIFFLKNSLTKHQLNRIQRCSLSQENLLLIFQSLVINLQVNDSLQIIE